MKKVFGISLLSLLALLQIELYAQNPKKIKIHKIDTTVHIPDIKIAEHPQLKPLKKEVVSISSKNEKLIDKLIGIAEDVKNDNELRRGAIFELRSYVYNQKVTKFLIENIALNLDLPWTYYGNEEALLLEFPCYNVLGEADYWYLIPYIFESFEQEIYEESNWKYNFRYSLLQRMDKKLVLEICNYYLIKANDNGKVNIARIIQELKR